MKQRIIALIAVIAVMAAMLTVPVGATVYLYENFNAAPSPNDLEGVNGWKPYDAPMKGTAEVVDGCAKFSPPTSSRLVWEKHYNVTENNYNHIVMFDIMIDTATNQLNWQLFSKGTRSFQNTVEYLTKDVWYTFMFVVANNGKSGALYYKQRDAALDAPWTKVTNTKTDVADANGVFKITFDCYKLAADCHVYIDNYRIFTGTNIRKDSFTLNTTAVDDVSDITAAGTLKANYDVYSSDVSFDSANVLQSTKTVKAIMVAFDKNNKLLDCSVQSRAFYGGTNSFSSQLTVSDDSTNDMYFNNIKDDGYVGVYLWNGMQPLLDSAIELN